LPGESKNLLDSLREMELVSEEPEDTDSRPDPRRISPADGPILGIDLGTTNSSCAVVLDGEVVSVPTRQGLNVIPSILAIDPAGNRVVGHAARAQMEINPKRAINDSKRLLGRPFDSPVVRKARDHVQYDLVAGEQNRVAAKIDETVIGLEEVAAGILSAIRDMAQDHLGRIVNRAVITVPASYNENQRHAVRRAAELADLRVERLLGEPTAAAVAYGHGTSSVKKVMVYDLGGGTFDASLVNVYGNVYEVIATGGEAFLGGVDFDNHLMDHICVELQLKLGQLPQMERAALLRTLQAAEHAKRILSELDHTTIRLPFIGMLEGQPVDLDQRIDRKDLEKLVFPLVGRTLNVCEAVMDRAGINPQDLDAILLSGGQTRMPLIRRRIAERFGTESIHDVGGNESLAVGAALFGNSIGSLSAVVSIDLLSEPVSVGAPGEETTTVLPAGSRVPTSRTYAIKTFSDDQTEMDLPLFQGDTDRPDGRKYLGSARLRGIRPGSPGSRTLLVTFSLTPECLLKIKATDAGSGPLDEVVIDRN
jgi:molecular chaperone DnaK